MLPIKSLSFTARICIYFTLKLFTKNWCLSNNFKGEKLKILKIPYPDGRLNEVIIGEGQNKDLSGVTNDVDIESPLDFHFTELTFPPKLYF